MFDSKRGFKFISLSLFLRVDQNLLFLSPLALFFSLLLSPPSAPSLTPIKVLSFPSIREKVSALVDWSCREKNISPTSPKVLFEWMNEEEEKKEEEQEEEEKKEEEQEEEEKEEKV
jgi:hypothetical protein